MIILHLSLQIHFPPFSEDYIIQSSLALSRFWLGFANERKCWTEHHALVTNPRKGLYTFLPIIPWYQGCEGKHNSQALGRTMFTHIEKRQSKVSSSHVH